MKKLQMDAMANLPKHIGFTGEEKKDKDFCYKGEIFQLHVKEAKGWRIVHHLTKE